MEPFSIEQGKELVRATREIIEHRTGSHRFNRAPFESRLSGFSQHYGVFVTIEHYPTRTLRGCIGFPRATAPLYRALIDAAVAAATEDPRFVPVSHHEHEDMTVEVSVLSEPEEVRGNTAETKRRQVKVGRDGLIIEHGFYSGLLLPIVAVEENWNSKEFLENTCIKAGLPPDVWKRRDSTIYKFTTQLFRELSPKGPIEEIAFE